MQNVKADVRRLVRTVADISVMSDAGRPVRQVSDTYVDVVLDIRRPVEPYADALDEESDVSVDAVAN